MTVSSLSARLNALRETIAPTPFPLFLFIYNNSGHECCIDNMIGAQALYNWLSPIDIPKIDNSLLPKVFPTIINDYTIERIAHLFYPLSLVQKDGMASKEWFSKTNYIKKLVVYFTCKEVVRNERE